MERESESLVEALRSDTRVEMDAGDPLRQSAAADPLHHRAAMAGTADARVTDEIVHEQVVSPRQRMRTPDARKHDDRVLLEPGDQPIAGALLAADFLDERGARNALAQDLHQREGR